ncbi:nickel-dependent lactate racemase [Marispirochaeta aestuarii]|uniref:nickel-dependent lactate racemase n=1 Tax=Marispirochaeta aestuarii TaxID=1963862 RepID=UPI0029C99DEA|nr:nickel-dependent lactate racemase [Marispirochaeta aestuarii]
MHFDLKYGKSTLPLETGDTQILDVIHPGNQPPLEDPAAAVERMLQNPLGTAALEILLRKRRPERLVIVVNDITRPTPYSVLMPPLLRTIENAGTARENITLITATGIHSPHTLEENLQAYGKDLVENYRIICHDAEDEANLVHKGRLPSGYDFLLNRTVDEADFLITIGVVMPHFFAGYSGGRKSILPGVSGKSTVQLNHARMVELMDDLPPIRENPISLEMIHAARMAGVDFILNAVSNDDGEVINVYAGDLEEAWYAAVEKSEELYITKIPELADITVVSASGFPRDINIYQAQKALDHADKATRRGGTIILLAECSGAYGDEVFENFMKKGLTPESIMQEVRENFVMGGHKAYCFAKVAAEKQVILVSSASEQVTLSLFAEKAKSPREALETALRRHGKDAAIRIMPEGGVTVPSLAS